MDSNSTDQLINKIIELGLRLPYYEWEVKQFAAEFPADDFCRTAYFDSFREACEFLINKMS